VYRGGFVPDYRHPTMAPRKKTCGLDPLPWVRADQIESAVLTELFNTFGNASAIERAVKAASTDGDSHDQKRTKLQSQLGQVASARNQILSLIEKGLITSEPLPERAKNKRLRY
jgi:hypothetical protein